MAILFIVLGACQMRQSPHRLAAAVKRQNLNTSIQERKENTEFNIVDRRPWQAHMASIKIATLEFPVM